MDERGSRAWDWGLRIGIAASSMAVSAPLWASGELLGLALVPGVAAALLVARPALGAWLVLAWSMYVHGWPHPPITSALGLAVLGAHATSSRPRLRVVWLALPLLALLDVIASRPSWSLARTGLELVALVPALLAALWLIRSAPAGSERIGLTESALSALLGIVIVGAMTWTVSLDAGFEAEQAEYYACIGPRPGEPGRVECGARMYAFAWSAWLALGLLVASLSLFARRKTASLFLAAGAVLVLWVPEWRSESLLGERFMGFPEPHVMSCMHWPHAVVWLQLPMRALLVVAWLPWIRGMQRMLAGRSD